MVPTRSGMRRAIAAAVLAAASTLAGCTAAPQPAGGPRPAPQADCHVAKCVALTYDDGPSKNTARLLDELRAAHAPATFFLIGQQVPAHADEVRRAQQQGIALGDHSWSHPHLPRLPLDQQHAEVDRAAAAIERAAGARPALLRPPYGDRDATTATLGYPVILWDVDTRDWATHSGPASLQTIQAHTRRGSIILLHDVEASSVDETPAIIAWLRAQGYALVTVPQLLGPTVAGHSYSHEPSR